MIIIITFFFLLLLLLIHLLLHLLAPCRWHPSPETFTLEIQNERLSCNYLILLCCASLSNIWLGTFSYWMIFFSLILKRTVTSFGQSPSLGSDLVTWKSLTVQGLQHIDHPVANNYRPGWLARCVIRVVIGTAAELKVNTLADRWLSKGRGVRRLNTCSGTVREGAIIGEHHLV